MNKEELLQTRLAKFVEEFALEVGEPSLGALIMIHWKESVSQGLYLATPAEMRKGVVKNMGNAFLKTIESLKARLSVTRLEHDNDEVLKGR